MADEKNILFVCVENARRSQMAESIFNELAKKNGLKIRAISAGTMPSNQVDPNVVRVLKEIGIEVKNQTPKSLTNKTVAKSDKIITMGCLAKKVCPSVFIDKTIDWNIEDPKDKPLEKVREIRDVIKAKTEELVRQLSES